MSDITVLKLGGSVLRGREGYVTAASWLQQRLEKTTDRFVVVVSAAYGHTDELYREARELSDPSGDLLDLLWSTGETRSVALLALKLRDLRVRTTGIAVHEIGLAVDPSTDKISFDPRSLRAALATHRPVSILVNNKAEGCAPLTIRAIAQLLADSASPR